MENPAGRRRRINLNAEQAEIRYFTVAFSDTYIISSSCYHLCMVITAYSHERGFPRKLENFLQFMLRKNATAEIFHKKFLRNFPIYGDLKAKLLYALQDK